ncbi:MAG: NUDIX domain-containing protein [Clostridiaceae bacterium]
MKESHVVTCFVENDGEVLIVKRGLKVGTYQQKWSGISGYIEVGITPMEQAWQELREEAGLDYSSVTFKKEGEVLVVTDEKLDRKWFVHPFRFALADRDKIVLDWENLKHIWIDPEKIPEYETVPGLFDAWEKVK